MFSLPQNSCERSISPLGLVPSTTKATRHMEFWDAQPRFSLFSKPISLCNVISRSQHRDLPLLNWSVADPFPWMGRNPLSTHESYCSRCWRSWTVILPCWRQRKTSKDKTIPQRLPICPKDSFPSPSFQPSTRKTSPSKAKILANSTFKVHFGFSQSWEQTRSIKWRWLCQFTCSTDHLVLVCWTFSFLQQWRRLKRQLSLTSTYPVTKGCSAHLDAVGAFVPFFPLANLQDSKLNLSLGAILLRLKPNSPSVATTNAPTSKARLGWDFPPSPDFQRLHQPIHGNPFQVHSRHSMAQGL